MTDVLGKKCYQCGLYTRTEGFFCAKCRAALEASKSPTVGVGNSFVIPPGVTQSAPKPVTPKRVKPKSRPQRWADACSEARVALDSLQSALSELESLRAEYEEWKDNLPENMQSSPVADKLEVVCDFEFEGIAEDIESLLDEVEAADLPRGFGRD